MNQTKDNGNHLAVAWMDGTSRASTIHISTAHTPSSNLTKIAGKLAMKVSAES